MFALWFERVMSCNESFVTLDLRGKFMVKVDSGTLRQL